MEHGAGNLRAVGVGTLVLCIAGHPRAVERCAGDLRAVGVGALHLAQARIVPATFVQSKLVLWRLAQASIVPATFVQSELVLWRLA